MRQFVSNRVASNRCARLLYRDERAVAAVEFALVGLVFLLVLFTVIEFSLLVADNLGINRGLEAAVRYGVVNGASSCGGSGDATLQPVFNSAAQSMIFGQLPTIAVSCSPAGATAAGTTLTVTTSLDWAPLVFASDLGSITINGSVTGVVLH